MSNPLNELEYIDIHIISLQETGNSVSVTTVYFTVLWCDLKELPKVGNVALLPQYHNCHVLDLYKRDILKCSALHKAIRGQLGDVN